MANQWRFSNTLGITWTDNTLEQQGPVVQSIVSLTSLLRGQLVKCFTTLLPNTLIFFDEKMREVFALQKLLTFFSAKNIGIFEKLTSENLTKR